MLLTSCATLSDAFRDLGDLMDLATDIANIGNYDICDRTAQVRWAIVNRIPNVDSCREVTTTHLESITGTLDLSQASITELQADDFSGLSNLSALNLEGNQLTTLPDGTFSGLSGLSGHSKLNWLNLSDNQLTTLPQGIFSELSNLFTLNLSDNQLPTLPQGIFSGLSNLSRLDLDRNPGYPFNLRAAGYRRAQ